MCQICTDPIEELIPLTMLDCSNCPLLTSIPSTLINLTELQCFRCPLLTSIPPTLINLTILKCFECPLLTSIPSTLIQLRGLGCSECPLLTSIPSSLINLEQLYCLKCPLLTSVPDPSIERGSMNYFLFGTFFHIHCPVNYFLTLTPFQLKKQYLREGDLEHVNPPEPKDQKDVIRFYEFHDTFYKEYLRQLGLKIHPKLVSDLVREVVKYIIK